MLEAVSLRNFQNHRELEVTLSRVSILVGDNGAGKSAVLRALRWVMLNEWPGEAGGQVTWGEDECLVTLSLDGHTICRGRKSDKNLYMLDDQEFHAFGTLLPQPISALTRVIPENFQDQDEPAFWLYLSRGQAATALNEIFSLDSIDSSLANVAADLRMSRMKASVCQERLEDAKGDEQRTRWAVQADTRLQELEGLQHQLEALDREILQRQEALEVLTTSEELRMRLESLTMLGEEVVTLHEQLEQVEQQIYQVRELITMEEELCRLARTVESRQEEVNQLQAGRCPLCGRK